jgi:hypothetical protein
VKLADVAVDVLLAPAVKVSVVPTSWVCEVHDWALAVGPHS